MVDLSTPSRRYVLSLLLAAAAVGPACAKDGEGGGGGGGGGGSGGGGGGSGGGGGGGGGGSGGGGDRDRDRDGGRDRDRDRDRERERERERRERERERRDRDRRPRLSADEARRRVERGDILPLATVLGTVRSSGRGKVVKVDLVEAPSGRLVYEFVVHTTSGELVMVAVDARRNRLVRPGDF